MDVLTSVRPSLLRLLVQVCLTSGEAYMIDRRYTHFANLAFNTRNLNRSETLRSATIDWLVVQKPISPVLEKPSS